MTAIWAWFVTSRLGRALAAVLALLAAFWATHLAGKRKGAQEAKQKGREADAKRADTIRRRAGGELHDDGSGYRD